MYKYLEEFYDIKLDSGKIKATKWKWSQTCGKQIRRDY
jgi:hypothetical protein